MFLFKNSNYNCTDFITFYVQKTNERKNRTITICNSLPIIDFIQLLHKKGR